MSDLITVVIPCFNAEPYLRQAIDSCLQQTYPSVEIVVIDDGSTDASRDILASYGDAIRWETQPNRGGCAARNRGVELARGEWIQFLDADDFLGSEKLAKQIEVARQYQEVLIFCDAQYSDPQLKHPHHCRLDRYDDPVVFLLRGGLQTSAPLHRKEWVERIQGFRVGLPCAQERDFHLRLAASGIQFQRLPEVLYSVRAVAGSVSASAHRVLLQHLEIAQNLQSILAAQGTLTENRKLELGIFLLRDAKQLARLGDKKQADVFFNAARHLDARVTSRVYGKIAGKILTVLGITQTEKLLRLARKLTARGVSATCS